MNIHHDNIWITPHHCNQNNSQWIHYRNKIQILQLMIDLNKCSNLHMLISIEFVSAYIAPPSLHTVLYEKLQCWISIFAFLWQKILPPRWFLSMCWPKIFSCNILLLLNCQLRIIAWKVFVWVVIKMHLASVIQNINSFFYSPVI